MISDAGLIEGVRVALVHALCNILDNRRTIAVAVHEIWDIAKPLSVAHDHLHVSLVCQGVLPIAYVSAERLQMAHEP